MNDGDKIAVLTLLVIALVVAFASIGVHGAVATC